MVKKYCSIDEAQSAVLSEIISSGHPTSPRGEATVESLAVSFSIQNPRARCVVNRERRWHMPLALGELCWHLSGSTDANSLTYYARAWRTFADSEGQIRGSCYGSKVFSPGSANLWDKARDLLRSDPATRRAVLYFNDTASHLDIVCPDAACASSLQFLIREGYLHAFVCMRSNDVIWGLPYDVFLFTFLQEMMALELGVRLGEYHHFATISAGAKIDQ
jgi:thymidylate synthase